MNLSAHRLPQHYALSAATQPWAMRRAAWLYEAIAAGGVAHPRGGERTHLPLTTEHLGWIDLRGGLCAGGLGALPAELWRLDEGNASGSHQVWGVRSEVDGRSVGCCALVGYTCTPVIRWEHGRSHGGPRLSFGEQRTWDMRAVPGIAVGEDALYVGTASSLAALTAVPAPDAPEPTELPAAALDEDSEDVMVVSQVPGATPLLVLGTGAVEVGEIPCWVGYDAAGSVSMVMLDLGTIPDFLQEEYEAGYDPDRSGRPRSQSDRRAPAETPPGSPHILAQPGLWGRLLRR